MINDLKKQIIKERRIESMNRRIEASQTINPVTGQQYLDFNYPKVRRLEDPIQAHLRAMEERNPSANEHKQGFLKDIGDRLSLIGRALEYRELFHIFKVDVKKEKKSNFKGYGFYSKLIKPDLDEIIKNYGVLYSKGNFYNYEKYNR